MTRNPLRPLAAAAILTLTAAPAPAQEWLENAWLSWRGPAQVGRSLERALPQTLSKDGDLAWSIPLPSRGTPVVAGGHLYCMAYEGEEHRLQEMIRCVDVATGKTIWEHRFTDFLTDSIYYRFAIGSPTVDPETGNVLCMSTAGLLNCFSRTGEVLWQRSMMSEYGRLTFPNGRTGAPLIDEDRCIVHVISAAWGKMTPARDRFYAFDKKTGEPLWSCTPGGPPKDSSFSMPAVVAEQDGRRVLYAGLGGGHIVAVDARSGDPLWKFPMSIGGINSSALPYGDDLIVIHGKENRDSSTIGRMIRLKRTDLPAPGAPQVTLGDEQEVWRNDLVAFTSSPVLVGNRVYQTVLTGDLCCVDADTGKVMWRKKLAASQIHASPTWANGLLYVPMNDGTVHVVRPADEGPVVLDVVQLDGNCLGAPAIAGGRVFVHTTEKLYCFGKGASAPVTLRPVPPMSANEQPARLQIVPGDILLKQGDSVPLRARGLTARGTVAAENVAGAQFAGIADGVTIADGKLQVAADAPPVAFLLTASAGELTDTARIRIVPKLPFALDMESMKVGAFSPKWWVAAGSKWQVIDFEGSKVLSRTLKNPLFQRTMSLIGHPDSSNYEMQVDLRSDGNRRMMSSAGVVHQRYLIVLKGNHQQLEVSSNMELLKVGVPFKWKARKWYRLKTRVDVAADGSGVIRAKVWLRDQPEPDAWTIEVPHAHAHKTGSPGLYGFTPQSRFSVYLDNLSVTPY